jgi:hypothetical protein
MKIHRLPLAAAATLALLLGLFAPRAAAQTEGQQCGTCTPGADLGLDNILDCNNPAGWTTTLTAGGCTYVNKVTMTACGWGVCAWHQYGPKKSGQIWGCLQLTPCNFRVRWEYQSTCNAIPNVTFNCALPGVFPCTAIPGGLLPAAVFTNVLPPDIGGCPGINNNDNYFTGMGCGQTCTFRFTIGDATNKATVALRLGCGLCVDQAHGGGPF